MKKLSLLCTALAALMLTSCVKNNEELISAVPTETTSLTLTVSLTEPEPPPEPVPQLIEFAVYDPFADVVKVENSVRKELAEAVEKLSDARGFLYADPTCFYEKSKYYTYIYFDDKEILEENKDAEYEYFSLNIDIAQTEEELVQYMRSCFTENFISDEELQNTLFEATNAYVPAEYKTIDGTLCMRHQYLGVAPYMQFDKFSVLEYDGTSARIAAYGESVAYPSYMIFMEIVKSEEYGWRLDSMEIKECWQNEAEVLYNGVTLRTETINKILYGGNAPENPKTIEIDGETYTQTDLDMTLPEMLGFFEEMFHGKYNAKKYITEVYAERDGVLYRKNSAPRWYLPEMQLDPCYGIEGSGPYGDSGESELVCEQEFYDSITDESFTRKIRVIFSSEYLGYNEEERRQEFEYEYIHITSELPIKELE